MGNFTIYTDKPTEFDFKVEVEGASLDDARARLVFENVNSGNYVLEGKVNRDGSAIIHIPKMKGFMNEHHAGNVKLEMIVEDSYFEPWAGSYSVAASKKVVVNEVSADRPEPTKPSKPKMRITINSENKSPYELHIDSIVESLQSEGINRRNVLSSSNKGYLFTVVEAEFNKSVKDLNTNVILEDVIQKL